MRLDKAVSSAGWGSRTEVKQWISGGRVTVDGAVSTTSTKQVDPLNAAILLDGVSIDYKPFYWLMLHKPKGVVSATTDPHDPTVLSLLDKRYQHMDLFPVGRLDKDSTGLILLTNDGSKAHTLLSPGHHIPKRYRVTVEGVLTAKEADAFASGIILADGLLLQPAGLTIMESGPYSVCMVTLTEGKYHQIKRMFGVLGFPVEALHRLSMGNIILDEALAPGGWRQLTEREIASLY